MTYGGHRNDAINKLTMYTCMYVRKIVRYMVSNMNTLTTSTYTYATPQNRLYVHS